MRYAYTINFKESEGRSYVPNHFCYPAAYFNCCYYFCSEYSGLGLSDLIYWPASGHFICNLFLHEKKYSKYSEKRMS